MVILFRFLLLSLISFSSASYALINSELSHATVMESGTYGEGDVRIHFSAYNSTLLKPKTTASYGFRGGDRIGMVSVLVQRELEGGQVIQESATEESIMATTMDGVRKWLRFKRVMKGKSVYHLANFPFVNGELVKFTLTDTPRSTGKPQK